MGEPSNITAIAGFALCLLVIYKFILYPTFVSPLAKIPNAHPTASTSSIWILWTRYQRRENKTVLIAHQKYGPVVRLGPNELSVCCIDGGLRTVYGGGFEKKGWYQNFVNYGVENMFSSPNGKQHGAIKKLVSNVYSKSFISSSPAVHDQTVVILHDRLLPILAAKAEKKEATEVVSFYFGNTMDFITAFLFGLSSSSNFLEDEMARNKFLENYEIMKSGSFWTHELPGLTQFARSLGIRLITRAAEEANAKIEAWNLTMCKSSYNVLSTARSPRDEPTVYGSLKTHGEKELAKPKSFLHGTFLADPSLGYASEVLDHLIAGFETSGITLTYLTHALSLRPAVQEKLRAELLTLKNAIIFPPPKSVITDDRPLPDYKELDSLPILHAILLETLRLHSAIPGIQPRITPVIPGGTTLGTGDHIYSGIPGGVRVQASAHALHRNTIAFPDPEEFKYERWLEPASEKVSPTEVTKERAYWAFGSGSRMCVGSNFAIHELKMVIAAIYTNFKTVVVDDQGIEQMDGYTVGPKSGRLLLRFEKADLA